MNVFESSNMWAMNLVEGVAKNWAMIPTMGALHQGHLSLIREAQKQGYRTIVSIFVNPLQFNNPADLEKYPRHLERDLSLLSGLDVDAVWTPSSSTIYPENFAEISLDLGNLDQVFEGYHRPGHFNGVVQVLHRLFSLIKPEAVFFGQKDLQQCLVVERLLHNYFPQIQYFRIPTQRATSGLALSSRNERLSAKGKETASEIYTSMVKIENHLNNYEKVLQGELERLNKLEIEVEYLDWVTLPDMQRVNTQANPKRDRDSAIVFAGFLEGVRLIDNLIIPAS